MGDVDSKMREGVKRRCKAFFEVTLDLYQCAGYRIADQSGGLGLIFVPNFGLGGWVFFTKPRNPVLLKALLGERFGAPHHDLASGGGWRWSGSERSVQCIPGQRDGHDRASVEPRGEEAAREGGTVQEGFLTCCIQ